MMKKYDLLELSIKDIRFPSTGVAYADGIEVLVKNTIPGQRVLAKLTKMKKRYEASLVEVLSPAPGEIPADCPQFGLCGGCAFRSLSYAAECRLKEQMVADILREGGFTGFTFDGLVPAPCDRDYRNKMEFSFGDDGLDGNLTLGLRKRGSYYETADVSACGICDADFRAAAAYTLSFFRQTDETFYHRTRHTGALRYLVVRKGFFTGELLVNLVTTSAIQADVQAWAAGLAALPWAGTLTGALHTVSDSVADTVAPEAVHVLSGRDYYTEKLLGLTFRVSAFSFFQTNAAGAERLYASVREFAGDTTGKTLFDLYCGTGTIAQLLADGAARVTGVELVEEAVAAARLNASANNLTNCEFIAGDVLKVIGGLTGAPEVIVLDPPREGMHPKALAALAAFGAETIVYVSCKPTSMATDLAQLTSLGYAVQRVRCHDMFPRTNHVETAIKLQRRDT